MACAVRYRVPAGGPKPENAEAREERPGDPWPPRPRRLAPQRSRSTIGEMRRQGILRVGLHCYGLTRDGVFCHNTAEVALDALGLPDDAPYDDFARHGWRCSRCGHRTPSIAPRWPDPREAYARRDAAGQSSFYKVNGIVMARYAEAPAPPPLSESPAMPAMPDPDICEVVEDDEGTFAIAWAATGRIVEWNGTPQRGLTADQAGDVADHSEAIDRIAMYREIPPPEG